MAIQKDRVTNFFLISVFLPLLDPLFEIQDQRSGIRDVWKSGSGKTSRNPITGLLGFAWFYILHNNLIVKALFRQNRMTWRNVLLNKVFFHLRAGSSFGADMWLWDSNVGIWEMIINCLYPYRSKSIQIMEDPDPGVQKHMYPDLAPHQQHLMYSLLILVRLRRNFFREIIVCDF